MSDSETNLQFDDEVGQLAGEAPNPANLKATPILDYDQRPVRQLAAELRCQHKTDRSFLQGAHGHFVQSIQPIYALNEFQPASRTMRERRGSCSQRMACLEAAARAGGVATRVRALRISGEFWYPRFRTLSMFIPKSILLAWPQFYLDGVWVDFDEIYGSLVDLAKSADHGFSNAGESVFDAVAHTPIDFMAKTCAAGCSSRFDLSSFVLADDGFFDTRDEVFERFGSLHSSFRGRIFEILFGGRKSV